MVDESMHSVPGDIAPNTCKVRFVQGRDGRDARDVSIVAEGSNESKGVCNERSVANERRAAEDARGKAPTQKSKTVLAAPGMATAGSREVVWAPLTPVSTSV